MDKSFNYSSGVAPEWYVCEKCGRHGIRLFRSYSSSYIDLFCLECSAVEQKQKAIVEKFDYVTEIGWRVAAIPDEEGNGYWGYTSVPNSGIDWWRNLPNW